jgi:peptidoglycan/xylan/chitin deacetylase (PgdA/CDA1 family)
MHRFLAFAALILAGAPVEARDRVALTFDDLPGLTKLKSQAYVTYFNEALLRGLKRHHLPATGFVNEGKLDDLDRAKQIRVLRRWVEAGMPLGNHTFSHESPNGITAEAYIADIKRGETITRPLLARHGEQLQWFRHPYLETGTPGEVKRKIDRWLGEHGYRIAPVTMENSDWLFAEPYDDAIARHDAAHAARIREAYLDYSAKMIDWYRRAAHELLGKRDFSFIMLLHSTRLNADSIDALAVLLRKNHLRGVSLRKAMSDPAYMLRDSYVGPDGIEWLERWSMDLHRELPWDSFTDPPAAIKTEYDRVDKDRPR